MKILTQPLNFVYTSRFGSGSNPGVSLQMTRAESVTDSALIPLPSDSIYSLLFFVTYEGF